MEVDDAISTIRRQRQAFACGIKAVHTLYNTGIEAGNPFKPLPTNTDAEPVYTSALVNARMKMNSQLQTATINQLAMQLLVAVCEPIKRVRPHWPQDPEPTIRVFRLIRNGVAHGNEVSYQDNDPPPNTSWKEVEFTKEIEGEPLFTQPDEYMWETEEVDMIDGLFEAGDALALTSDVLKILIEESETFDIENIVGLSLDGPPDWAGL